jgi:hypothetical protein
VFLKIVNVVCEIPENDRDVPNHVAAMKDDADVFVTCAFVLIYK